MFKKLSHKAFLVGGAVRNELMGFEAKDLDYVIEDTTEEELLIVFPEAKKVGLSFPVYLIHGHEVALARTEFSTGDKYQDFDFVAGVSIDEDLGRRDLTINSIARNVATGEIVDPFNGQDDIIARIIRTINVNAFIEDPVRILRAIRFACEFSFSIESTTFNLMSESVHRLAHVPVERVDLELEKVYKRCDKPSEFFRFLDAVGGLDIHFPELKEAQNVIAGKPEWHIEGSVFNHVLEAFDRAKEANYSFAVAISALAHDLGKLDTPKEELPSHKRHEHRLERAESFISNHRFDAYTNNLVITVAKNHMRVHALEKIKKPVKLVRFIRSIKKHHLDDFFNACDCDARLTDEQKLIVSKVVSAINSTKIELPVEIQKKGKDAIVSFVENQYVVKYKEISK